MPRRIGLHHIAFLRGYFEGLDVAVLADQYLALGRDKKRGLAAKRWIVEELVAAARKQGDAVGARLLRLPAGALPELDAGASTRAIDLEDFREQVDPDGVYSEAELVDLLQATIKASSAASSTEPGGQARRAQRNTRLRHRQRALLERLEHALAEPPRAHHPIGDWLDAALAARLARAGLETLAELASFITARGYRWYRHVPRVGEQAAIRIHQWMERNAADLHITLPEQARVPRNAWSQALCERVAQQGTRPREGIAPIEYFAPACLTAQADRALLLDWLSIFHTRASTFRAYRTQAERLLLWAVLERRVGLSEMTTVDANAFFAFVTRQDLPAAWRGPKAERQTAAWRPIEKSPAASSVRIACRILKSAFDYLCLKGHCDINPFVGLTGRLLMGATVGDTPNAATLRDDGHPITEIETPDQGFAGKRTEEEKQPTEGITVETPVFASEREHASSGSAALSNNEVDVTSTVALRRLRLAVVHALVNATAWPLSTLVQLRTAHLVSTSMAGEGMSAIELCFHNGRRVLRARLEPADVCLITDYCRMREVLPVNATDDPPFLIGRHGRHGLAQVATPITPNVLARTIKQYYGAQSSEATRRDVDPLVGPFAESSNRRITTSFRGLRAYARQQLRLTSRPAIAPEWAMKATLIGNLQAFGRVYTA